jgi:hypothetical protein
MKVVSFFETLGRNYPNTTAQQHTRTGSSTDTQWEASNRCLRIIKNVYYFWIVYCVVFMHERLERKKFLYLCVSLHEHVKLYVKKFRTIPEHFAILNASTRNFKKVAVVTAGWIIVWQPTCRPHRHVLLLWTAVAFVRVYRTEALQSFPSRNWRKGFLPWKWRTISVLWNEFLCCCCWKVLYECSNEMQKTNFELYYTVITLPWYSRQVCRADKTVTQDLSET